MIKTTSRLVMTAAAASLAFAPIAATANTRAADSKATYTTASAPGEGVTAEGEKLEGTAGILVALLAAAAIVGGIIIIAEDDDDDNQSPGGN
ncbi:MAG: hypothetical protein AAFR64_00955 [Pseudomonadota bacterium]